MPAWAEESAATEEGPVEATQEEMDEAYDEAMMQADSEITFLTMEDLNYRLTVIMKFASGTMTDEDLVELKNPEGTHLLYLDAPFEMYICWFSV